jgi:hypothetical protein
VSVKTRVSDPSETVVVGQPPSRVPFWHPNERYKYTTSTQVVTQKTLRLNFFFVFDKLMDIPMQQRLLKAAGGGDRATVIEILDAKCDVNAVDAEGWSPLILASKVLSSISPDMLMKSPDQFMNSCGGSVVML